MSSKTIDYLEPLTIDDKQAARHENEWGMLARLFSGMNVLYHQAKRQEAAARMAVGAEIHEVIAWGNVPGFREAGVDRTFLGCAFDWYAINACRFFNLLGFVSSEFRGEVELAKAYRRRVCGPVLTYRNKVAAHYALTDPKNEDNRADLMVSTMDTVAYEQDRFYVGTLRMRVGGALGTVQSQHDYRWSLTEFHETVVMPRIYSVAANG